MLEQKIAAGDAGIASLEKELTGVTSLVEKGIAVAARQSETERLLASYRADRLDQVTAVMRARQGVAEATRNLDGLRDRRRTEIASDLQTEQSSLEQAMLKREVAQKLLLDLLATGPAGVGGSHPASRSSGRKPVAASRWRRRNRPRCVPAMWSR